MNLSIVMIFLLPIYLDVVYSDESTRDVSSVLELFPEFVEIKDEINKLKKGVTLGYNRLKNYRVKGEYSEGTVLLSGQECWIKCTETDGCTSASFQTEGGKCELSRVTYINHEVLERAIGWDVFTKHTPVVSLHDTSYSLDFVRAKAYCVSLGLSIATFEDLKAAHKNGYQKCSCGWAENGHAYLVMQEVKDNCLGSVGVIGCTWQSTWNVYCKPLKALIKNESQNKQYAMTLAQARSHCESIGTSLATMEDMLDAYRTGFEACSCGWVDNGYAYIVMQKPTDGCMSGVGIIACSWQSTWNAWCKVK